MVTYSTIFECRKPKYSCFLERRATSPGLNGLSLCIQLSSVCKVCIHTRNHLKDNSQVTGGLSPMRMNPVKNKGSHKTTGGIQWWMFIKGRSKAGEVARGRMFVVLFISVITVRKAFSSGDGRLFAGRAILPTDLTEFSNYKHWWLAYKWFELHRIHGISILFFIVSSFRTGYKVNPLG